MPVLSISQQPGGVPGRYLIEITATGIPNVASLRSKADIQFNPTAQDRERIRWYMEDYLQFDEDPAPQIAKSVEADMAGCGEQLFRSIFEGSPAGIRLWNMVEPHLSSTRIEVITGIAEATAIPWELIRCPSTRTNLALSAQAFVRGQREAQTTLIPTERANKVRILLVICRPHGGEDVPFRSVAGRLVTRLSQDAHDAFDLDVLRPPTFEQLATTLRLAKDRGRPYHIVHFDGHGTYGKRHEIAKLGKVLSNVMLKGEGSGPCGYLAFEDPNNNQNCEFVDGFKVGALLRDAGVPFLILNACQSAFAEAPAEPKVATEETRGEVEAYGSLAQAVMEAGAAGVVAMRYSIYVVTAAQFVAELYGALSRGGTLGEAVTWARKNLADQPERRIAYDTRPLQDWSVPLVWERDPLRLWPENADGGLLKITLDDSAATPGGLDPAAPARPDVGFYGRDETLYALDRAFDTHNIVLLHAYAGSGKTTTAAEFARWYALTGGIEGPVLFSNFEHHLSLDRVLDKIGAAFDFALKKAGIHWDTITDPAKRQNLALQVLRQISVLYIWDNVEPVAGFPAGTASEWSTEQQQELRAFLSAARDTKAKFLLTSRRDEAAWLGDLPRRVQLPSMPMLERLQFAGAIAEHRGKRLAALPDLTPLLRFTQGNPLTILVTVGAALRAGIDSKAKLDAFIDRLRSGEATFQEGQTEGCSKSLGASLSYGFNAAFDEDERKILALLHLFQGFVYVHALQWMGSSAADVDPRADWGLDAVSELTRDRGITLLDRAAEIGLLNAHGDGNYTIHPALPWYFRTLFEHYFPEDTGDATRARRAFVETMGDLSNVYLLRYQRGNRGVISAMAAMEENFLAARRLARVHGWWRSVILAMQSLYPLYSHTGRRVAWRRLVEDVVPDFVDSTTEGPLPGREESWIILTQHRAQLVMEQRDWREAERLWRLLVDWNRNSARPALAVPSDKRSEAHLYLIRALAVSLKNLGDAQREQGRLACTDAYLEAVDLGQAIGDASLQAACALHLGHAYNDIPVATIEDKIVRRAIFDRDTAEHWYRKSFELTAPDDALHRSTCLSQLGLVAYLRFEDARAAQRPIEGLACYLAEAANLCEQALATTPATHVAMRATTHNLLGKIYENRGEIDRALRHYQECIRYEDESGDVYNAGFARYNVALAFVKASRLTDARAYAEAALANFQTFGDRAAFRLQETKRLLEHIGQAIAAKGNAP